MNNISYLPLTFVSTAEDIKRHISNTIIMKHVIESEGQLVKLEELLESTQYGYTASAQQMGSHRLLRITDIQNGEVNWDDVPFCDCERPEKYIVQKGDILVARTGGTTGKSFFVTDDNTPENVIYASYLIKLRVDKEKLLPGYLNAFMNSYVYWSQITEMKSGSAQPNVNANKLKELMIPYCSIHKQKELIDLSEQNVELNSKIIKACNQYDKVRHAENLLQEQDIDIDLYRKIIIQNAIQGKLVEQDDIDEPSSVLLEKIRKEKEQLIKKKIIKKEKPLPKITDEEKLFELPKGWEWIRLQEVTYNLGQKKPDKKFIYIDVSLINKEKGIISEDAQTNILLPEEAPSRARKIIQKGSVIYSTVRPYLLNIAIVNQDFEYEPIVSTAFAVLNTFNGLENQYLYYYLRSQPFIAYVEDMMVGMAYPAINEANFYKGCLPLPPLNEQKRIIEKVNQLMLLCDELEAKIVQSKLESENLMKAVLQEAFAIKEEVLN